MARQMRCAWVIVKIKKALQGGTVQEPACSFGELARGAQRAVSAAHVKRHRFEHDTRKVTPHFCHYTRAISATMWGVFNVGAAVEKPAR